MVGAHPVDQARRVDEGPSELSSGRTVGAAEGEKVEAVGRKGT